MKATNPLAWVFTQGGVFFAWVFFRNPDISNATGYGSYDPSKVIGLDPVLGDIIFEASEIPLLRGGWYDRNGTYFADEDPSKTLLWNSVNIITKGVIDYKNRAGI